MNGSLVVVNPNASRARDPGQRQALIGKLDRALSRRDGTRPRIVETTSPDETAPLVRAALADGVVAVIGVGGDGTMRDIAAELVDSPVPLGVVPAGTGNQVAAVLGIPLSLDAAAAVLEGHQARTLDLGEVTLRHPGKPDTTSVFILGCGAGFDARLMATTPRGLKQKIGKSAYLAQAVRLGLRIDATPCTLTVDGRVIHTDASIAVVGNLGQPVPGLIDLRLPIDPSDGLLDLIAVAARGPVHGLRGLVDQLRRTGLGGGHGSDSIRLRGQTITIETAGPWPLEVDGDYIGDGSLSARVLPGALDVLVPGPR